MGRAVLICLISSLIFTLTPHVQGETSEENLQSFAIQYSYLIQDGRHSLADKLLHKRMPEMEKYMEAQPEEYTQAWKEVVNPLLNGEANQRNTDKLSTFLDFLSTGDRENWVQEQVDLVGEQVRNVYIPAEQIQEKWNELLPILPVVEDEAIVTQANILMDELIVRDHVEKREELLDVLEQLKDRESFQMDALLWTAIVIGGTIIITLLYVAVRRWMASKKTQSQKSESS